MASVRKIFDINYLRGIKKYTPLDVVVESVNKDFFVDKHYYRVSDGIFFQVSNFLQGSYVEAKGAPFVVAVLVCINDSCALRIISMLKKIDGCSVVELDDFFDLEKMDLKYGSILNFFRSANDDFAFESASYRVMVDGEFIYKSIDTNKYKFFFKSESVCLDEPAFGFLLKLS